MRKRWVKPRFRLLKPHQRPVIDLATWSQRELSTVFAIFKRIVNTKTSIIQMGPNIVKRWLENESKSITILFLRTKMKKKKIIICTMDDVRGDSHSRRN